MNYFGFLVTYEMFLKTKSELLGDSEVEGKLVLLCELLLFLRLDDVEEECVVATLTQSQLIDFKDSRFRSSPPDS